MNGLFGTPQFFIRGLAFSTETGLNAMKVGLRRDTLRVVGWSDAKEALGMLYVGLDFSRKRLQWSAFDELGAEAARGVVVPEPGGLSDLVERAGRYGAPVLAAIESMTGSRFVHDQLELRGWDVRIADAQRVKGRGWRRLPARPTGSTRACSPSSPGAI
jgi:hypothetical protein